MSAPAGPDGFVHLDRPVPTRPTGRGSEVAEVTPSRCFGCGASWGPGQVQLGHQGARTYRCAECEVTFVAAHRPPED